ncbi:60S ribosomal protein L4 [Cavenderia fasciculata]|uniref:60S ribosomal protein L4 n=1 Tax=Cavenderia fasciculata TaxID=261658 RepID=F4QD74_CACFS|nr:60S ribosomal protein L4 [Cavenderia fasciculata]EGG14545.1 60S ribosomal protein L4 [Cavenderia fasciculata]|eukprot:XP_004366065.1 60S ribosomal protein L4 [Cavenderia fasciculata]
MNRDFVNVFNGENKTAAKVKFPAVLGTPIRPDLVNFVHTNVNKNHRQAYGVYKYAGEQTSAESWGTGRAVARIPRVGGSGTHRSGQGAFGNMCRGGRMFGPNKVWRKWNRRVNVNQKRYAVCSALAASAIPALVMARGHRVNQISEVPLVIANEVLANLTKTSAATALLKKINAYADVERVIASKSVRAGQGKLRNRRFQSRRGPLLVLAGPSKCVRAFRNIPGVDIAFVSSLNILRLAPGGHLGRFVIWSQDAFEQLDKIFGTKTTPSAKKGFRLPRPVMLNPDVSRIVTSDEIQTAVRESQHRGGASQIKSYKRLNPLRNVKAMLKLNPHARLARISNATKKATHKKGANTKAVKTQRKAWVKSLLA